MCRVLLVSRHHAAHYFFKLGKIDWLRNVGVAAGRKRLMMEVGGIVRGNDNYGNVFQPG